MRDDRGLTMIEVLVAAVLTSILSLAILQVISATERGLRSSVDRAVETTQTVRLSQLVTYDFAGAREVFVFDAVPPVSGANLCGAAPSALAWSDTTRADFSRVLFAVQIPTVSIAPGPEPLTEYLPAASQTVMYAIRRDESRYILERQTCAEPAATQLLLDFGPQLPSDASGQALVRCLRADGTDAMPRINAPTMSTLVPAAERCAAFSINLPNSPDLSATAQLMRELSLQKLGSEVTPA